MLWNKKNTIQQTKKKNQSYLIFYSRQKSL